jgi:single-strand DNA-binding protein
MKGLNKVMLIGNVGKTPELRNLENNVKVAHFSLATTETYKDEKGETHSNTEWHNVVLWRNLADLAEKYLTKGSTIYLEGKLKTRSYQDKNGINKYVTEIIGDKIIMLD